MRICFFTKRIALMLKICRMQLNIHTWRVLHTYINRINFECYFLLFHLVFVYCLLSQKLLENLRKQMFGRVFLFFELFLFDFALIKYLICRLLSRVNTNKKIFLFAELSEGLP